MGKNNNLQDFMADLADAIREKKGTTEKINPQDFSDEIKSIKTSTSMWTGHVDVEGLKAIGWDDEDIAYFQEHGVNWMEEDDEYYKVSDDNKSLYGVVNADNIQEYKDRIVWLPKIDFSGVTNYNDRFRGCSNMIGMPYLGSSLITTASYAFGECEMLSCIPMLNVTNVKNASGMFQGCINIQYIPTLKFNESVNVHNLINTCFCLSELRVEAKHITAITNIAYNSVGLKSLYILADTSTASSFTSSLYGCRSVRNVGGVLDAKNCTETRYFTSNVDSLSSIRIANIRVNFSFSSSRLLTKASLMYMIEHEAATSDITITLHATAYARLATDPDIVAALENHPLVSLASA